jgi:hypothetical protein
MSTTYEYTFHVRPRALPADWRDTAKSPHLLALWQLVINWERVRIDMTEAKFKVFRKGISEAGYDLEGIRRTPLPFPEAEDVD